MAHVGTGRDHRRHPRLSLHPTPIPSPANTPNPEESHMISSLSSAINVDWATVLTAIINAIF